MKTCYIESLGCAKNLVDSEHFAAILADAGYQLSFDVLGADIVLINTCAFLQSALAELEEVLETVVELKQSKQIGQIIVSGCVMNRQPEEFIAEYPEVDHWLGLKDFAALSKLLNGKATEARAPVQTGFHAYLRISDGCENYCSYCKIPSIRGGLQSKPIEALVEEARALAKRAVIQTQDFGKSKVKYPQELVLIAQDSCLYGMDIYGRQALPELLEALQEVQGFQWIRLMYLHPDHFLTEWLPLFNKYPRLLPYFEIPVQHCNDKILKAMNRKKNYKELLELFAQIMAQIPQAVLRTTLITGFPGEKTSEAKALERFINEVPFLHMGAFAFSPEEGTPAFSMTDRPSSRLAINRRDRLNGAWYDIQEQRLQSYVDKSVSALVETQISGKAFEYKGRAWFQAPEIDGELIISGAELKTGSIVDVIIDDVIDNTLFGHPNPKKRI